MAKRGRKKKFKLKFKARSQTLRSMLAMSLIGFSVLIVVITAASFAGEKASFLRFLREWFGFSLIFLAPPMFVLGLLLVNNIKWKIAEFRVFIGLTMFFVASSGFFHIFYLDDGREAVENGLGGGAVGFFIASSASEYLSVYGAGVIFLLLGAVSVILVLDKSIEELVESATGLNLSKIPLLSRLSKNSENDDETEIVTGELSDESEDQDDADVLLQQMGAADGETAPEFEIIPNVAEPVHAPATVVAAGKGDKVIGTIAPGVPHANTSIWEPPPLDLLDTPPNEQADRGDVAQQAKIIETTLASFNITAKVVDTRFGPSVTQYALRTESGTRINAISNLQVDLAAALASPTGSVRIEAPIPGRSEIGIEVPNRSRETVYFKDLITSDAMKRYKDRKLAVVLGKDVGGAPMTYDMTKMPHLLIAGATNSGKSVFIHNLMFSILFRASPDECKFVLVDPKRVELVHYNDIPHLHFPVITDVENAPSAFRWAVDEMNRRYKMLEAAKAKNIESYNEKSGFQAMHYIVIIVDELGEIMVVDQAAVEKSIIRLAQLSRAVGIHLVLAMQRPTTNIITGLIKANIPCRIAFNVTNQIDSRVIIDQQGAEKLMGMGDMLFVPPDANKPVRLQGAFVREPEIQKLVTYLKSTGFEPEYKEIEVLEKYSTQSTADAGKSVAAGGEGLDPLFNEALEILVAEQKASASLLQRRLSIGYSRAARILDELEAKGYVGPAEGSKPRKILIDSDTFFGTGETQLENMGQHPETDLKYPSI